MKSTWFGDRSRYDFARLLVEADPNNGIRSTFPGFLTVAAGALRQGARKAVGLDLDEKIEEDVIREQKRVKHPERYAEAFGLLVGSLHDNPDDFLGTTMSELGQNDAAWKGQCFTPMALCRLTAGMVVGDAKPDDERSMWLAEPAVGGGAMMIAASLELKARGFWPWHYHWVATDVDRRCFEIAYIQASLLGIPATIIHGNTLTLEEWTRATTIVGVLHPPRPRRPGMRIGNTTNEPEPVPAAEPDPEPWKQGNLF
jgi:hypothetical protein